MNSKKYIDRLAQAFCALDDEQFANLEWNITRGQPIACGQFAYVFKHVSGRA